ncbi:hypothetical protein ACFL2Q_16505 [Thermodesulfobacteriota bacterium]
MNVMIGEILRQVVALGKGNALPGPGENKGKLITPDQFYSKKREKTKLNWFCFEYALELEKSIQVERGLDSKLTRKGVDAAQIAQFCVHYSKHMKEEVLHQVSGRIPQVRIRYEPIESFFPKIGDALVDQLLTTAAKAWDSHLGCCVMCPTRCISEKDQRATMFDDPQYWG